jgi:hypothetical protein
MTDLDLTNDIIDVRDIIARIEEIDDNASDDDRRERAYLETLMTELETCGGGDEQWRGDWYPITLIADSYFTDYAQELAEDCGMINDNASWPNNCIDWDKAARELRIDYTPVTIGGKTYWTR